MTAEQRDFLKGMAIILAKSNTPESSEGYDAIIAALTKIDRLTKEREVLAKGLGSAKRLLFNLGVPKETQKELRLDIDEALNTLEPWASEQPHEAKEGK